MPTPSDAPPMRLLVSSCLLGEAVRYDGQHKRDAYVVEFLGRYFELVPVCPEVEVGMGVPRETIRLVKTSKESDEVRLVAPRSGTDWTDRMAAWAQARLESLAPLNLCGYVCKKGSPSSGMTRVPVYNPQGSPVRTSAGLFTGAFMQRFPLVPVEEEGRLNDPVLRENFLERVFRFHAWQQFRASKPDRGALVAFHTDHKLLLLTHSRTAYTELGRWVAAAASMPLPELLERYGQAFFLALARPATRGRTTDVLLHMLGHFRRVLDPDDRSELLDLIFRYRRQEVPLVVPLTLFQHHLRRHPLPWLTRQVFLNPHPAERMLRNLV